MKSRIFTLIMLLPLFFIVRCTKNTSEEKKQNRIPSNAQTYEFLPAISDTVNKTDINGFKQGRWIVLERNHASHKMSVVEEGSYVNNEKDGIWKYYDSSGKIMRLVKFKNGRAW